MQHITQPAMHITQLAMQHITQPYIYIQNSVNIKICFQNSITMHGSALRVSLQCFQTLFRCYGGNYLTISQKTIALAYTKQ
jgi:hypothetical protein